MQKLVKLKKHKDKFIPTRKLGRNEPCHCGFGEKYKRCCLENDLKKYGGRIRVPTPLMFTSTLL